MINQLLAVHITKNCYLPGIVREIFHKISDDLKRNIFGGIVNNADMLHMVNIANDRMTNLVFQLLSQYPPAHIFLECIDPVHATILRKIY